MAASTTTDAGGGPDGASAPRSGHTRPHVVDGGASSGGQRRERWRKVLYLRQPYPDNHVDRRTFMASLTTTGRTQRYSYMTMLRNSVSVVFQVCVLSIVFVRGAVLHAARLMLLYSSLVQQEITAAHVLAVDGSLMAALYAVVIITLPAPRRPSHGELARSLAVFAFILLLMSPVLRTLTASFSTDTVWALTIALSGFALASHDYTVPQPDVFASQPLRLRGTTSLNASMFASVLVTSRLHSTAEVFVFETFCILMFGLAPVVRQCLQVWSTRLHVSVTAGLACGTLVLLYRSAAVLAALFVLGGVAWLLCPAVFLAMQKFKTEIHGPWDIANVVSSTSSEGGQPVAPSRRRYGATEHR